MGSVLADINTLLNKAADGDPEKAAGVLNDILHKLGNVKEKMRDLPQLSVPQP